MLGIVSWLISCLRQLSRLYEFDSPGKNVTLSQVRY